MEGFRWRAFAMGRAIRIGQSLQLSDCVCAGDAQSAHTHRRTLAQPRLGVAPRVAGLHGLVRAAALLDRRRERPRRRAAAAGLGALGACSTAAAAGRCTACSIAACSGHAGIAAAPLAAAAARHAERLRERVQPLDDAANDAGDGVARGGCDGLVGGGDVLGDRLAGAPALCAAHGFVGEARRSVVAASGGGGLCVCLCVRGRGERGCRWKCSAHALRWGVTTTRTATERARRAPCRRRPPRCRRRRRECPLPA